MTVFLPAEEQRSIEKRIGIPEKSNSRKGRR